MAKPIKEVVLKDGSKVSLGFLVKEDFELSLDFFRKMPDGERLFLRRDVTKREILQERITEVEAGYSTVIAAADAERIVGDALLFVQPSGLILAIPGNERNRVPVVEEFDDRLNLANGNTQAASDLPQID